MPIQYVDYPCPCSKGRKRAQGHICERSDVYRAVEHGDNHAIFGWRFRCRTCGCSFFVTERRFAEHGKELGRRQKLKEAEERKYA